jgi:hypothetical protein
MNGLATLTFLNIIKLIPEFEINTFKTILGTPHFKDFSTMNEQPKESEKARFVQILPVIT